MDVELLPLLSRWLHVLGAIALLGGAIFVKVAFTPLANEQPEETRDTFHAAVARHWAKWVGILTGVLLLTGFYNYLGVTAAQHKGDGPYHALMGVKMLAALAVFFLSAALVGRSEKLAGIRRRRSLFSTLALALGITTVLIAGYLKMRGVPPLASGSGGVVEEVEVGAE